MARKKKSSKNVQPSYLLSKSFVNFVRKYDPNPDTTIFRANNVVENLDINFQVPQSLKNQYAGAETNKQKMRKRKKKK